MTSEDVWLERVVAWRKSGVSAAKFCEGTSYDASSLRTWSSRLGRAGKVARSPLGRRSKRTPRSAVAFARVMTTPTRDRMNPTPLTAAGRGSLVVSVGPTRIELAAGFDPELLRAVVSALAAGAA
jgi:hypothetical protein